MKICFDATKDSTSSWCKFRQRIDQQFQIEKPRTELFSINGMERLVQNMIVIQAPCAVSEWSVENLRSWSSASPSIRRTKSHTQQTSEERERKEDRGPKGQKAEIDRDDATHRRERERRRGRSPKIISRWGSVKALSNTIPLPSKIDCRSVETSRNRKKAHKERAQSFTAVALIKEIHTTADKTKDEQLVHVQVQ